jgi:hypothetical protein
MWSPRMAGVVHAIPFSASMVDDFESLPQRPHAHVLGQQAERFVMNGFPPEWVVREVFYDYGLDLNVELTKRGVVTGQTFSVQVKAFEHDPARPEFVPVRLRTSTINYMKTRPEPVMVVAYVADRGDAYWTWIDDAPLSRAGESETLLIRRRSLLTTNWAEFEGELVRLSGARAYVGVDTADRLKRFGRYSIDLRRQTLLLKEEVDALEKLVEERDTSEADLQAFFEQNPHVVLGGEYIKMHAHVRLEDSDGVLIPDFLLESVSGLCDVMEIKLPSARVAAGSGKRTRLSYATAAAVAQAWDYRSYFDEAKHRDRIEEAYRLRVFRPRLLIVAGRDAQFSGPLERRRLEVSLSDCRIFTYDDVIRIGRAQQAE